MSFTSLKEFIKLAKEEGVKSLKFENDKEKFEVEFSIGGAIQASHHESPVVLTGNDELNISKVKNVSSHLITSPFVGTFYQSSGPGKPAFVKVGDKVKKGQVLCILEAMKIMNEIESDCDGEIIEICKENESLVEYGETIFCIKKY